MQTEAERRLKLKFLIFARQEVRSIRLGEYEYRNNHDRLAEMIVKMRQSGYLTDQQSNALTLTAARALGHASEENR